MSSKFALLAIRLMMLSVMPVAQAACLGLGCNCGISANPINFGSYPPFNGSTIDTMSTVSVTCNAIVAFTVSYVVTLNPGNSGTFTSRHMLNGASQLLYNIYTDSGRTTIWGSGSGGTGSVSDSYGSVGATTRNYTTYARLPGLQNIPPGNYTDAIIATVTY